MYTIAEILKIMIESLLVPKQEAPRQADQWTWYGAYALGYREPKYPVPTVYKERL